MPKVLVERNKTKSDKQQTHWSEKQKYNAVALYKMTGNASAVSRSLGIPLDTIFKWKSSTWWPQFEADLLQEKRALTTSTLDKLSKKASEITADRLENGDWVYVGGKLQRKPVNALVANKILQDSLLSEIKLEEHYSSQNKAESDIQINERLKLLFDEMTRFANSKEIRSTEGGDPQKLEVSDAVHEKREA
jgi:hypothetical protein